MASVIFDKWGKVLENLEYNIPGRKTTLKINKMREDKQLQFRNDIFEKIIGEATRAQSEGKKWYVSLTADKDFNLKKGKY